MSFPVKPPGKRRALNSRVTSNRRLRHILHRMIARNTRETMATLGEKGPADVEAGKMFIGGGDSPSDQVGSMGLGFDDFDSPSVNRTPWTPPWEPRTVERIVANPNGEPELIYGESADAEFGRHFLVKLGDAADVLKQLTREQLLTLEARLARINNYRAWTVRHQARKIYGRNLARAMGELYASVYRQTRKRYGTARVSTRSLKWRVKGDMKGKYSGLDAYKQHEGRPALSAAQWLYRYEERLKKRRKHPDRARTPHRVTIPDTIYGRPGVWPAHEPEASNEVPGVNRPEVPGDFGTHEEDSLLKEGLHEMLKEMGKELGDEFKKWIQESLEGWAETIFGT